MIRGIAVVTGGTRGIGLELCRAASEAGFEVLTCSRTSPTDGFKFRHLQCDLSDPTEVERLARTAQELGQVRLLVNNAGAILATEGLQSESADVVLQTLQVNVVAPITLARLLAPAMADAGGGLIVNVASLYGAVASPYVLSYAASKAALLNATRSLAVALAPAGVRVNSISPGNVDTEMTRSAGEDYVADVESRTPLKRLGDAADVGHALRFLLDAGFVTGEDIVVDGGIGLVGG